MSFVGNITQLIRKKYFNRFEEASKNPVKAQWEKLSEILSKNENTEFGKNYGFWKIHSVSDYQKALPILTYADLKPYVEKMLEGQKNILTHQEPLFYGMTTGSTGSSKFTPITKDYRDEYQTVVQSFIYYIYKDHPKAFDGKALYFTGSAKKQKSPSGVDCGTMSGFNFRNLPKLLQSFYALPYELTDFKDSFSKFYCMVLLSIPQNITLITAITGAPVVSFAKTLINNAERLIKDIHDGTLDKDLVLTEEERAFMQKKHKANPQLAKKLEEIMKKNNGVLKPMDVWNNIELLVCWKASNAGGFIKDLENLFGKELPIRDAIYSATEGWCNIPYSDEIIGGPLAINAHFYEFIEENDLDNNILLIDQLEQNKKYKILYTTSGGIYRYDIGDILEVVGMYNKTPVVKFVRKTGQTCNIAGELITDAHITQAIMNTKEKYDISIPFYCAVPNQESFPPYYDLLIELPNVNSENNKEICKYIDEQISEINCDYKSLREDNELNPISLKLLEKESMNTYIQEQVKNGADEGQIKPLVLSLDMNKLTNLKILEEVKL
ncbi:MAG: GH3 auxin-responsive promoter family protein [Cyanobacteriota bacterium]